MYDIVFLLILKVKHIYNRLILAYRTESKLVLIVLMFSTATAPPTTFRKFCAFKILFFATTSFGAFFLAFASNEFFAYD